MDDIRSVLVDWTVGNISFLSVRVHSIDYSPRPEPPGNALPLDPGTMLNTLRFTRFTNSISNDILFRVKKYRFQGGQP